MHIDTYLVKRVLFRISAEVPALRVKHKTTECVEILINNITYERR